MALDLILAKQHLRVTHSQEDALIQQYMDAASSMVEQRAGVLLTRREVTQRFSAFETKLPLFWGPDPDLVTVAYVDTDEVSQEIINASIVREWLFAPPDGWPVIFCNTVIEVIYTAGY